MGHMGQILKIWFIVVLTVLAAFCCASGISAQESGPKTVVGRVYDSDGENPGEGFEGTYAAVVVRRGDTNITFVDPDGIFRDDEGEYWYIVVIPQGKWEPGDVYWIAVDGTGWGDGNGTCRSHEDQEDSWEMGSSGSESRDVNTMKGSSSVRDSPPPLLIPVVICVMVVVLLVLAYVLKRTKNGSNPPRLQY